MLFLAVAIHGSGCGGGGCNKIDIESFRSTSGWQVATSARMPSPKGALVLDAGLGAKPEDAIEMLSRRPGWRAIAVEPEHTHWRNARQVLQASFGDRATTVWAGVASRSGTMPLNGGGALQRGGASSFGTGGSRSRAGERSIEVNVTTLDDLVDQANGKELFFAKIDVQGFELEALKGARRLLKDGLLSWLYLEFDPNLLGGDSPAPAVKLVEFLRDHGFVCGPAHRQVCYKMPRSNGRRCYTDLFCGLSSKAFAQPGWVDRLTRLARAMHRGCYSAKATDDDIASCAVYNRPYDGRCKPLHDVTCGGYFPTDGADWGFHPDVY